MEDTFVLAMLASPSPAIRERAARALARLQTPEAAPALAALLAGSGEAPEVRAEAAFALGQIGLSWEGLAPERAREVEVDAVLTALGAVANLKAACARPQVLKLLGSPNASVRLAAAKALKAIDGKVPPFAAVAETPGPYASTELPPRPRVRIHTHKGAVVLDLLPADAPNTVKSFLHLVRKGFFDGLTFHRVVPNFVAQGGDPRGDGSGGPGYSIRCEVNRRRYEPGIVGMALSGKDTGGSQFFITTSRQPHLDGRYTVFGRVAKGQDVVEKLLEGDLMAKVEEIR